MADEERVTRAGRWARVLRRDGSAVEVSRRCRHQLADLSAGSLDTEGCLVCPWHGSRYALADGPYQGRMVTGPRGFLGWHGPTPGYTELVLAVGRVLRLRVRSARDS